MEVQDGPVTATWSGRTVALAGWLALLTMTLLLLHAWEAEVLSGPPASVRGWTGWWAGTDPVVALMSLVRLLVLGLAWYLVVVSLLALVARGVRSSRLQRIVGCLVVPPVRELLAVLVGVALISGTAAPASATPASGERAGDARVPVGLVAVEGPAASPDPQLPTLRQRPGRLAGGRPATALAGDTEDPDPPLPSGRRSPSEGATEHVVAPGESFWSIATGRLASSGRSTEDAVVARYWLVMIDANRDRLAVPGHPDLLLPGQRLWVPPVTAPERVP